MFRKKAEKSSFSGFLIELMDKKYPYLFAFLAAFLIFFKALSYFFPVPLSFQAQLIFCAAILFGYFVLYPLEYIKKRQNIIFLALILIIFLLSIQVRLATVNEEAVYGEKLSSALRYIGLSVSNSDQPYLLAADPHYWHFQSEYAYKIITGEPVPEYDYRRLHPEYLPLKPQAFSYTVAYSYKYFSYFKEMEFYRFLFWLSAVMGALCVIPAFWLGRELHSNTAGLFAAFFIGLTPSYLSRSMGGFLDTDGLIVFLSLLTMAFFISAYKRADSKNPTKPLPLILAALSGLALAMFAFIWGSGFAYMPWLFMGLFGLHFSYMVFLAKGSGIKQKAKNSLSFFKSHFAIYIVLGLVFLAITFPYLGFSPAKEVIAVTTFFQSSKAEGGIFPNVLVSISEAMSVPLMDVVARTHPFVFGLGILGLGMLLVLSLQNIGKDSIFPVTFLLMFIWIAPTLYGSLFSVRFVQLLAIPMGICAGIAVGILFRRAYMLRNYGEGKELFKLVASALIITFMALFFLSRLFTAQDSIYMQADILSNQYGTGITSGWASSMGWLKENTPECTVVATYWDPGYWIASLSERRTIYDGATQNNIRYTAVDDLNGLDCMKDRQGYTITWEAMKEICERRGMHSSVYCPTIHTESPEKLYCVTSRMQDMAGVIYTSEEIRAAKVLETYMGECKDLYFLASNDLIGKSHWWSYFSNWDPEAGRGTAYPYSITYLGGEQDLRLEKGKVLIYDRCPPRSFCPTFIIKITESEGVQSIEPYLLQDGKYYGVKTLVIHYNGTPMQMSFSEFQIPGTLWVDPSMQVVIYMPPQIENSMFTKTFFYGGQGLEYFEPSYAAPDVKLYRFNVEKFREDFEAGLI
jgi:dolichyl-diphosphooligosaccharide--protein glycosyltransferase